MRYVRIDRDGDLSIAKGIKNPWKFSWLEEEQNIEDLLVTPSSKKVYSSGQEKGKKKSRANLIIMSRACEEETNIKRSWNFRNDLICVSVCEVHIPD